MKKLRIFLLVGCPKPAVLFTFSRVNIFQKIQQTDELSLLMLQQIPSRLYSAKHFRVNISKIFPVVCPRKLIPKNPTSVRPASTMNSIKSSMDVMSTRSYNKNCIPNPVLCENEGEKVILLWCCSVGLHKASNILLFSNLQFVS